jgi:O-antigen/teichoic acid export membrane protein
VTPAVILDESVAVRGARWYTAALLVVGLLNYAYTLLMTRLLPVGEFTTFAAGQGVLLWAGAVATASIPWVLAQALARARSETEENAATRFAMMACGASGAAAALVVGVIAAQFAGVPSTLALAASAFVIFLGQCTVGSLEGRGRMRTLSVLALGDNLLKSAAGLLLVVGAGLGDTGALVAFGIGGLLRLLWWPSLPSAAGRVWRAALANRDLWRRAAGIAGVQGLVTMLGVLDVVLVAMLPASRDMVASYQASAALSRAPLFVASAVGAAFFPILSSRSAGGVLAARSVRMYALVALPSAAVLATIPPALLGAVFPPEYSSMAVLLRFTAIAGLAAGGVNLVTTFFQAADDYSCLWWQGAGLAGYAAALLAGWEAGGIAGLAIGSALGATFTLALLSYRLMRRQGVSVLAGIPLVEPAVLAALLILLRPYPLPWLAAATLGGAHAAVRFLRYSQSREDLSSGKANTRSWRTVMSNTSGEPALMLLTDVVWRGKVPDAAPAALERAMTLARRNQVEGSLALAYPRQLSPVLAEVRVAGELLTRNIRQVTDRLQQAGIPSALIKYRESSEYVHSDFDLVVARQHWDAAFAALAGWYVHRSTYWLERSTKTFLYPPVGPALHLHAAVSWFGVTVLPTEQLLAGASMNGHDCLSPVPADRLRIWIAHAIFQELSLNLSELMAVRELLQPDVIKVARCHADREGWRGAFDGGLAVATGAIYRLDRGLPVTLPAALPLPLSIRAGAEHARHLALTRNISAAAREAALRVPLVIAKRRKRQTP